MIFEDIVKYRNSVPLEKIAGAADYLKVLKATALLGWLMYWFKKGKDPEEKTFSYQQ